MQNKITLSTMDISTEQFETTQGCTQGAKKIILMLNYRIYETFLNSQNVQLKAFSHINFKTMALSFKYGNSAGTMKHDVETACSI